MNHYERLGVAPDASHGDIRVAYLRAARRSHPDVAGRGGDHDASMAAINEAWAELADPDRRRRYDQRIGVVTSAAEVRPGRPPVVHRRVEESFRPFDDDDDDDADDDSFRFTEDVGDPATGTGRLLAMLPAGFVATALGAAILGMVFDSGGLLRLALVAAVGCIVSVVAIPLVVMGRAVRHEGRRPSP